MLSKQAVYVHVVVLLSTREFRGFHLPGVRFTAAVEAQVTVSPSCLETGQLMTLSADKDRKREKKERLFTGLL